MLKKTIITILLLVYFFCVHFLLFFISYWLYFSAVNNCFITGPNACRLSMTVLGTLPLIPLISSPLSTLIFLKSNKKVKWLLILIPIILFVSVLIIYSVTKP